MGHLHQTAIFSWISLWPLLLITPCTLQHHFKSPNPGPFGVRARVSFAGARSLFERTPGTNNGEREERAQRAGAELSKFSLEEGSKAERERGDVNKRRESKRKEREKPGKERR